jgi:hypothetical protein
MKRRRHKRAGPSVLWLFLLLALGWLAEDLVAQRDPGASVRISTDHWANAYVARLRARGYLPSLNPIAQPWRASDVARALAALDPDTLPHPAREWARLLVAQFGGRTEGTPGPRAGGMGGGGLRGSTSDRFDPLRPVGDEDVWPYVTAGGWMESGPVAVEIRLRGDTYLNDDPDGLDPGQRRGARSDLAYVALDLPFGSLELGRLARNWTRAGARGLMISDAATPYPQLGFELYFWRMVLRGFTGELESIDGRKRYVSAHRLDYATDRLVLSFGESNLYAPETGGLRLRFFNPVEFLFFDHDNQPADAVQNLMLDAQLWARIGAFTLHAEGLLDDVDVTPGEGVDPAPPRYAVTLAGEWAPSRGPVTAAVGYTQVSSYAYRTGNIYDEYRYLDRGLGEHYADFDHLRLSLEYAAPLPGVILRGYGAVLRQGEGDFRQPFPTNNDEFRTAPALFLGVREDTYRLALAGRFQPVRFAWLAWDLGYNWITNRDHVAGSDENLFSAAGELGVRVDFPFRRP